MQTEIITVAQAAQLLGVSASRIRQFIHRGRSVAFDTSAQKFYDLHDELQTIAKEKNITLPAFTVIKR